MSILKYRDPTTNEWLAVGIPDVGPSTIYTGSEPPEDTNLWIDTNEEEEIITPEDIGAYTKEEVDQLISGIPTPDVSGQISEHNEDEQAHADIRQAIASIPVPDVSAKQDKVIAAETAEALGLESGATVDEAFVGAVTILNKAMEAIDTTVPYVVAEGEEIREGDIVQIVNGYAKKAEEQPPKFSPEKEWKDVMSSYTSDTHRISTSSGDIAAIMRGEDELWVVGPSIANGTTHLHIFRMYMKNGDLYSASFWDAYLGSSKISTRPQLVQLKNGSLMVFAANNRYFHATRLGVDSGNNFAIGSTVNLVSLSSSYSIYYGRAAVPTAEKGIIVYSTSQNDGTHLQTFSLDSYGNVSNGNVQRKQILTETMQPSGFEFIDDNMVILSAVSTTAPYTIKLMSIRVDLADLSTAEIKHSVELGVAPSRSAACNFELLEDYRGILVYSAKEDSNVTRAVAFEVDPESGNITLEDNVLLEDFGTKEITYQNPMVSNGRNKVLLLNMSYNSETRYASAHSNILQYNIETKKLKADVLIEPDISDGEISYYVPMAQMPRLPSDVTDQIKTIYIHTQSDGGLYTIETQINGEAISIDGGNAGETVNVLYAGERPIKGIKKGSVFKTTEGLVVTAYSDNFVSVEGFWNKAGLRANTASIEIGRYSSSTSGGLTLVFRGKPKAVILVSSAFLGLAVNPGSATSVGKSGSNTYVTVNAATWGDNYVSFNSAVNSAVNAGGYYAAITTI